MPETSCSQISDIGTRVLLFLPVLCCFLLMGKTNKLTRYHAPFVMIFEHALSIIFYILIREPAWMSTWGKKGHVLIAKTIAFQYSKAFLQ